MGGFERKMFDTHCARPRFWRRYFDETSNFRGKPFDVMLRFSDVWAKRHGVWQVIYTHASRPPK